MIKPIPNVTTHAQRRSFINLGLKGIAVVPFGATVWLTSAGEAQAKGAASVSIQPARLPETDPQAKTLGYKADASMVDATIFKRKNEQVCANCQLYSGSAGSETGPCAIFSYRLHPKLNQPYEVSAKGWCKSWGPTAA